jgi:hypothetical protein
MMIGNRGETAATFRETLAFLDRAKPHSYIFACLSVYPGTRDFDEAVKAGWLDAEFYFERDFQELKTTFDASDEDTAFFRDWFAKNKGLKEGFREGLAEVRAIAERLGDHHAAQLDVGAALFREGDLEQAEHHVRRALDLGYPLPGLVHNYLACIAARRGDRARMREHFGEAHRVDPQHWVLQRNLHVLRRAGDQQPVQSLDLWVGHDFQLLERTAQPTLPGPLSDDFAVWSPPSPPPERPVGGNRPFDPHKLRVLTA